MIIMIFEKEGCLPTHIFNNCTFKITHPVCDGKILNSIVFQNSLMEKPMERSGVYCIDVNETAGHIRIFENGPEKKNENRN